MNVHPSKKSKLVFVTEEYKNVIECVKKIADYIMEKFNYRCTDGDCIYLMLHVVRLYETTLN